MVPLFEAVSPFTPILSYVRMIRSRSVYLYLGALKFRVVPIQRAHISRLISTNVDGYRRLFHLQLNCAFVQFYFRVAFRARRTRCKKGDIGAELSYAVSTKNIRQSVTGTSFSRHDPATWRFLLLKIVVERFARDSPR